MCGIAGIVGRTPLGDAEREAVRGMTAALAHRGPDGTGTLNAPRVALGMRRLAVIDPLGGQQPLYSEDRTVAVVVNGEIYNHVELRARLEARGHRFRTHSDCEVIVHLYEESGAACVEALRGMFAFALWDDARGRLLLARDRMGEKPLYLYESAGRLVVASELKALLASGRVPFELDPDAVHQYFRFQYVPEPRTPLRNVRLLPPATTLQVDAASWTFVEQEYWRLADAPPVEADDPPARIREVLEEVARITVRSDVPVGIALSGGVDSGALASLLRRTVRGELHAFTVGYEGAPASDERVPARKLAARLGCPFHEIELSVRDVVSGFPSLVRAQDAPVADIAGPGYRALAGRAREEGVPVLLQGQGGDELFWGYPWVRRAARWTAAKAALLAGKPGSRLRCLRPHAPASLRPRHLRHWLGGWAGVREGLRRLGEFRAEPADWPVACRVHPDFRAQAQPGAALYGERMREVGAEGCVDAFFARAHPWPPADVFLTEFIARSYLLANGIAQADRLAMAHSVEPRLPLLDHRLVETVVGLRKCRSDREARPKDWFLRAVADLVPGGLGAGPKRGFEPPVRAWHEAIFARYGSMLDGGALVREGILLADAARRLGTGVTGRNVITPLSFKALVLEIWLRALGEATERSRSPEAAACRT